jgi:hypothetical protein
MFFLVFLSRLINQKLIEMKRNRDRRRFLRMKIRQRAKRLRLCKFRKMMQRRRQLSLLSNIPSLSFRGFTEVRAPNNSSNLSKYVNVFLFPPDFLFWRFIWKYCVFSLLILARQSSADLENSGSLSLMSWHTLLKMSTFLLGVVSNCCWAWSSPHCSINKIVSSRVQEYPLTAIVFLIINILDNTRVFFATSMRIWSFTLFSSIAIDLVRLHLTLDLCK